MEFDIGQAMQSGLEKITAWVEGFVASLPNIVAAILVLILFWLAAKLVRRALRRVLDRVSQYASVNRLLAGIGGFAVLAVGLFLALGILELDKTLTSLLAGAGILGLAIGFAAQDSVENLISGVLIAIRRPFREGQLIETNGHFGTVHDVNLRATIVRTGPGQLVHVPNSEVYKNPIVNYTQLGRRRVDLACGVSYGDDLAEAKRIALEAIEGVEARDGSKEVELYYKEFGGSSIDFVVRFWLDSTAQGRYLAARSEAIERLKRAFDEGGITIPFPIRTLDFGVVGGRALAEELSAARSADGSGAREAAGAR